MTYKNGNSYEGDLHDNLYHGQGELHFSLGIIYKGQWVNGLREGNGIQIWPNGKEY